MISIHWSDSIVVLADCECWKINDFDWFYFNSICQSSGTCRKDNFILGTLKHPWVPRIIFRVIWASASALDRSAVLCYCDIPSFQSSVAVDLSTLNFQFSLTRKQHGSPFCSSLRFYISRTPNRSRHWLFLLASFARRRLGPGMFFVQQFSYQFVSWGLKHACGLSSDGWSRLAAR